MRTQSRLQFMHKLQLNKTHVNYKIIIKLKLWVLINLPSIERDYICMYAIYMMLMKLDFMILINTFCTVAAVDLTVSQWIVATNGNWLQDSHFAAAAHNNFSSFFISSIPVSDPSHAHVCLPIHPVWTIRPYWKEGSV